MIRPVTTKMMNVKNVSPPQQCNHAMWRGRRALQHAALLIENAVVARRLVLPLLLVPVHRASEVRAADVEYGEVLVAVVDDEDSDRLGLRRAGRARPELG